MFGKEGFRQFAGIAGVALDMNTPMNSGATKEAKLVIVGVKGNNLFLVT